MPCCYGDLTREGQVQFQKIWWKFLATFVGTQIPSRDQRVRRLRHRLVVLWITNFPDQEWVEVTASIFEKSSFCKSLSRADLCEFRKKLSQALGYASEWEEEEEDEAVNKEDAGPVWWKFIHAFSVYAPVCDELAVMESRRQLVLHWLVTFPCISCLYHANSLDLGFLERAGGCLSNKGFALAFQLHALHNQVNVEIGKPRFSVKCLKLIWEMPDMA